MVRRYDYRFDLTTDTFRSGLSVEVAPPGGNCFGVRCGVDELDDVTWNGAPAEKSVIASGTLQVCGGDVSAPGPLQIEAAGALEPATFLGLDVGFSRSTDMAGGEFTYLLSWVGGCDHFGPCDDAPSRLSEFHFEVTHPPGANVLCPGVLQP
ncbi:MAG TPA: hypothetical protein VFS00_03755, partial [Polyangiaceae bacterium]|nr:hypothetical protein [Polyangiaceae bacterium]